MSEIFELFISFFQMYWTGHFRSFLFPWFLYPYNFNNIFKTQNRWLQTCFKLLISKYYKYCLYYLVGILVINENITVSPLTENYKTKSIKYVKYFQKYKQLINIKNNTLCFTFWPFISVFCFKIMSKREYRIFIVLANRSLMLLSNCYNKPLPLNSFNPFYPFNLYLVIIMHQ